jgi:MFS family permease
MRTWSAGLWRHPGFRILWTGHTVSLIGSQVTLLALPLVAVLSLRATPVQMGLLAAAGSLPALLVGLLVGVWVDRRRRRPLLVASDLGRGVLLLTIPAAALFGWLAIEGLYVVAFLIGSLGLVSGVAAQSFLPALVGRERLVEANSKLEVSRSAAEIAGPGLAGLLIQVVTAPLAIMVDAVSFLVSGLLIGCLRTPEPPPAPPAPGRRLRREIADGLRAVLASPSCVRWPGRPPCSPSGTACSKPPFSCMSPATWRSRQPCWGPSSPWAARASWSARCWRNASRAGWAWGRP